MFGSLIQSVSAAEQFNNQSVQFERDTIIEFQFLESNNPALSTFGVLNLATGEKTPLISKARAQDKPGKNHHGTAGKAVRKPFAEFTFKSGTPYTLYLESTLKGKGTTTVYSAPDKNGGSQLAKFDNEATSLWTMTDAEATNVRNYLAKGGFLIFDDFAGNGALSNFQLQVSRVLPGARLVPLEVSHPIFHSFFEIPNLNFFHPYQGVPATFLGVYEDNDPSKRLLLIANRWTPLT